MRSKDASSILNIIINQRSLCRYNTPAAKTDKTNHVGFFFRKLRF